MSSTHSSLHIHLVFSTKNREPWFVPSARDRMHSYLGGLVRGMDGVASAVGGTGDHVHLLVGLKPTHCLSDFMRQLKAESSKWIKSDLGLPGFEWQEGYGAFTVGPNDIEKVRAYVLGQEEHHRNVSFQEEYRRMLDRAGIEYDVQYLW